MDRKQAKDEYLKTPQPMGIVVAWQGLAAFVLSLVAWACQDIRVLPPEIVAVDPATVAFESGATVTIRGRYFFAEVHTPIDSSDPPVISKRFVVEVGGLRAAGVTFVDTGTLTFSVPVELPVGVHDLTVTTPRGLTAARADALQVYAIGDCAGDADCADACRSFACVLGRCERGDVDRDADSDGFIAAACLGGDDCDDDPALCGAACHPGWGEGLGASPVCSDGWDNDCDGFTDQADAGCLGGFTYRKQIVVGPASLSPDCLTDLPDFPLLVLAANDPDLADAAHGGHVADASGRDIAFLAGDGNTRLDFEVEGYDGATGTLVAWVRLPALWLDSDTTFYLAYGSTQLAASLANPPGIWSGGYTAVLHLNNPSGGASAFRDSTGVGNDATDAGSPSPLAAGRIGAAFDFDGLDDYLTMGATGFNPAGGAVEAWVRLDAFPEPSVYAYVFSHHTGTDDEVYNRAYIKIFDDETWGTGMGATMNLAWGNALPLGTWHHLAIAWDGLEVRGYRNGALDFGPTSYSELRAVNDTIYLMAWEAGQELIDGALDELRVSDLPRSACWLDTGYRNQSDPPSFAVVGPEEAL